MPRAVFGGMTKLARWWLVGIVTLSVVISSDAWSQQTFQDLDTVSQFEHALDAVDAIRAHKKLQCIRSTVSPVLCECLSRNLPVETHPRSYASIANQKNEYEQLSAADKKIVGQCVSNSR
jgi:hypothetical protein